MTAQLNPQRDTRDYQQLDAAHHIHAFLDQKALNREGPRVMVRGDGLQLWDNDGKRYLDGMSGLWCTNLGYGRQDLAAAASRQLEQLPYYNMFFHTTHPAVVELSEMLFSLLPDHYSHAIYTNSGSEANEVLIRTVRRYWQILGKPQKKIMIGRWNGYHGSTLGSTALGGMKFMHEMGGMLPDFAHIDEPYWYANGGELSPAEFGRRAALQLEEKILELGAEPIPATRWRRRWPSPTSRRCATRAWSRGSGRRPDPTCNAACARSSATIRWSARSRAPASSPRCSSPRTR